MVGGGGAVVNGAHRVKLLKKVRRRSRDLVGLAGCGDGGLVYSGKPPCDLNVRISVNVGILKTFVGS